MWKQVLEVIRQVFTLTEATQRNQAAITALQKDLRDLSQRVDEGQRRCESGLERLAYEYSGCGMNCTTRCGAKPTSVKSFSCRLKINCSNPSSACHQWLT